jgi:rRNA maturation endonuclease Nob1
VLPLCSSVDSNAEYSRRLLEERLKDGGSNPPISTIEDFMEEYKSWYCHKCAVEVPNRDRCKYCGKAVEEEE